MIWKKNTSYLFIFLLGIAVVACKKDKIGAEATPYQLEIPSHFPDMQIPADNPMTVEGVALGRRLFYEKKLSLDKNENYSGESLLQFKETTPFLFAGL